MFHALCTRMPHLCLRSCQCHFLSRVSGVLSHPPASSCPVRNCRVGLHADACRTRPRHHPATRQLVKLLFVLEWKCPSHLRIICSSIGRDNSQGIRSIIALSLSSSMYYTASDRTQGFKRAKVGISCRRSGCCSVPTDPQRAIFLFLLFHQLTCPQNRHRAFFCWSCIDLCRDCFFGTLRM